MLHYNEELTVYLKVAPKALLPAWRAVFGAQTLWLHLHIDLTLNLTTRTRKCQTSASCSPGTLRSLSKRTGRKIVRRTGKHLVKLINVKEGSEMKAFFDASNAASLKRILNIQQIDKDWSQGLGSPQNGQRLIGFWILCLFFRAHRWN